MSRIGRAPIPLPAGVTINIKDQHVSVKGPKGELSKSFRPEISIKNESGTLHVVRNSEERMVRSLHGLTRTLVSNMVKGVTDGFQKTLEVVGTGYRAQMDGNKLIMQLGLSHQVEINPPDGLSIAVGKGNVITITGIDKQAVGDLAAFIRSKRPPEVYKGKGIKYRGEVIRRKAGKAAGGKKK